MGPEVEEGGGMCGSNFVEMVTLDQAYDMFKNMGKICDSWFVSDFATFCGWLEGRDVRGNKVHQARVIV